MPNIAIRREQIFQGYYKKKSEGASQKQKYYKANENLREQIARPSESIARPSESKISRKLNCQIKFYVGHRPCSRFFQSTIAPPSLFCDPPCSLALLSIRDLHLSITCRNMSFSLSKMMHHSLTMRKSNKQKNHTDVSVQCLHCKKFF